MMFLDKLFGRKREHVDPVKSEEAPKSSLKMRVVGSGERVKYEQGGFYSSERVTWFDESGTEVPRETIETTEKYHANRPFRAAGKKYMSWKKLCVEIDESGEICRDQYGREVLYLRERFPCFDSFDYLYEDRYYRWFFLREKDRLTRVYVVDESDWIYVTENVENLEYRCVKELKKHGWIE